MKHILLIVLFSILYVPCLHAQRIQCPSPKDGFTVRGPKFTTDIYERSKVTCRYYDRNDLKATLEIYFFQDYKKQKRCSSSVYNDADVRSWDYQVYGYITDNDRKDFYTKKYWDQFAKQIVEQAEEWALPCDLQGKMIRRPVNRRK